MLAKKKESPFNLQAAAIKHTFFFMFPCWPKALVLPKAEKVLQTSIQPYISSILEALMEPTSRGFSEVRDVFFKELVELSKNSLNGGGKEKIGDVSHVSLSASFYPFLLERNARINALVNIIFNFVASI